MSLHRRAIPVALLLFAGLAAGCHHGYQSVAPADNAPRLAAPPPSSRPQGDVLDAYVQPFYPLAVGNGWHYSTRFRSQILTPRGPLPIEEIHGQLLVRITGTTTAGTSHTYFIQSESNPLVDGTVPSNQFLVRQDGGGLYELQTVRPFLSAGAPSPLDVLTAQIAASIPASLSDPEQRAAYERTARELARQIQALRYAAGFGWGGGGPDAFEISDLRYPLRVGAKWAQRQDPLFVRTITGLERMSTPAGTFAAWRIRIQSPAFGPDVHAVVWYSHSGLVRLVVHAVSQSTDNAGNLVGRMVTDSDQLLDAMNLNGPIVNLTQAGER